MSQNTVRGSTSERGSALWGTGGRGGDRSSVLWGKGGRGMLVTSIAVIALAAPLAATAAPGKHAPKPKPVPVKPVPAPAPPAPVAPAVPSGGASNTPDGKSWIAKPLLDKATNNPNTLVDVIVQSTGGVDGADKALRWLSKLSSGSSDQSAGQQNLGLVGAVSLSLPAKWVARLSAVPGLIVTPDSLVQVSGTTVPSVVTKVTSNQLWPYESGNAYLWPGDLNMFLGRAPAIAVIDSGVQSRSDFGTRLIANVNLSTIAGNTANDAGALTDKRGHGTFVAGIAAGSAPDLAGASPGAPIVSIKVMNDQGMAKTSDVIAACQWILDNKSKYNIRVANFSLHAGYSTNFYRDPLDQAVEKLWFNNVVVVAAAGNYGNASGPSGVLYAPGNDPFVITVGAIDLGSSPRASDDTVAPFSAYGYTRDGFYKPDVAAPGRYMVGPIPAGSTITAEKSGNMVGTDRIQLSGTSFSAPVVAGTAASMLARHPEWTPDQVKGALMRTARVLRSGNPKGAGLGEITASRAAMTSYAPNPNKGLERFVSSSGTGGTVFDAMSWASAAKASMSWNSMSWTDQSWSDQSWSDQAWQAMSWTDMSWNSMSWTDMSWTDMSWTDLSQEDAAEGDAAVGTPGIVVDPGDLATALVDPDIAVAVDGLSPAAALGVTTTAAPTASAAAPSVPVPASLLP